MYNSPILLSMQVVVNNILTTYYETGSGNKTIVLLHGWADSHKTFSRLQSDLQPKYRAISIDLPGHGGTQSPSDPWGLDEYADFTANLLQKIGADNPYAFIGHSNGGAIAIRGLATGRLKSEKLVLLASAGIRNKQNARKLVLKTIAKTGKVATFALPKSVKSQLRQKLYQAAGSDMLVAEHLEETFKKTVEQDILKDAQGLKIPALLIYGSIDTDTPPEYGQLLHKALRGSKLTILQGSGHFVHHEQAEEVSREILEFLQA